VLRADARPSPGVAVVVRTSGDAAGRHWLVRHALSGPVRLLDSSGWQAPGRRRRPHVNAAVQQGRGVLRLCRRQLPGGADPKFAWMLARRISTLLGVTTSVSAPNHRQTPSPTQPRRPSETTSLARDDQTGASQAARLWWDDYCCLVPGLCVKRLGLMFGVGQIAGRAGPIRACLLSRSTWRIRPNPHRPATPPET
jgi:hypothetical protein